MAYQEVLTALADPTRRCILEALREEPRSVSEISSTQTVSRPAVSQHLKVLHEAGLVSVSNAGNKRIYAVQPEGLTELRSYLDSFWSDVLSAFAEEIERSVGDKDVRANRKDH